MMIHHHPTLLIQLHLRPRDGNHGIEPPNSSLLVVAKRQLLTTDLDAVFERKFDISVVQSAPVVEERKTHLVGVVAVLGNEGGPVLGEAGGENEDLADALVEAVLHIL